LESKHFIAISSIDQQILVFSINHEREFTPMPECSE